MSMRIESYTVSFQCDKCGRIEHVEMEVKEVLGYPMSHHKIDFNDLVETARECDFIVNFDDESGPARNICFECASKKWNSESLPGVAEHNRTLIMYG